MREKGEAPITPETQIRLRKPPMPCERFISYHPPPRWSRFVDVCLTLALYHERMSTAEESNAHYASYMLRLRLMGQGNQTMWVASVENTATGIQRSFPGVEALVAFLRAEFGGYSSVARDDPPNGLQGKDLSDAGEGERPFEHE